jgi:hypothetical protein
MNCLANRLHDNPQLYGSIAGALGDESVLVMFLNCGFMLPYEGHERACGHLQSGL